MAVVLLCSLECILGGVYILCCTAALMADIYEDHKDDDGFLYITYSGESTFGHVLQC